MTTQAEQPVTETVTGDGTGVPLPEITPGQPITLNVGTFEPDPFPMAPPIRWEDISWRVDSKPTKNNRARFISYIDARTAAKYLDEWVGPDGWEETYEEATLRGIPVLWCHLVIHFPLRSVTRSDLAVFKEGRGGDDAQKLEVGLKGWTSNAFKRAATKYGIGRTAYELPEVWAPVRVDDRNRAWPNDQTMPAILRECREKGYEVGDTARVDHVTTDDETVPQHNWFREAKIQVFENVDKDKETASRVFTEAMQQLGIDSIDDQLTCDKVVAAATSLAIAETLPDSNAEVPAPETSTVDAKLPEAPAEPDQGEWLYQYGSKKAGQFELAARRAVLAWCDGSVGSAKAMFNALTEGMEHPLSKDNYYVVKGALNDPGPRSES